MFAIAAPPCPPSLLRRLDPRWKLASLILAAAAVIFLQTVPCLGLAFAGAATLAVCGRVPWRWGLMRLGVAALLVAPFLLLLPVLHRDSAPAWDVGDLRVSVEGLRLAILLALKALTLVVLLLVLLATAPLPETLQAAHALRIPGPLVQVAALSYRYVFVLGAELQRLRMALRVRGYRHRATLHSYRTVGHVAGTLLVRGYEQGERVGQAMRCRGFDGEFRTLTVFRTRPMDVVAWVLIVGCAAALLIDDLLRR